ncbi:MAG: head-tail connector protein [Rickettsiales bacterium]
MSTYIAHAIERITPPASEPVTLAEAKNYLRVEHTADDALIGLMITAARESAEAYLGTSFITQRWKMTVEDGLPERVTLRYGLVQGIVSIVEKTEAGGSTTLDASAYRLSIDKRAVHILSPRTGFRFEITYDAGYGATASLIPGLIRQGVLQHVAAMYEQREMSVPMPAMALQAYHPYKEISL